MALFMAPDGAVYEIPPEAVAPFRLQAESAVEPASDPIGFEDEDEPEVRLAERPLTSREVDDVESALRQFARLLGG